MSVRAFLSSTSEDLISDCRPLALDGIRHGGGHPVAMETWVTPYGDPVEVCRNKLKNESNHYVGVFAHRYGSRIPNETVSFTQAEFTCAREVIPKKKIGAFLPSPGTSFNVTLLERARGQSPEEHQAQLDFIEAVKAGGTTTLFDSAPDLYQRVKTMVEQWDHGSLRDTPTVPDIEQPTEAEICELGREDQVAEFRESYAKILSRGVGKTAGFVIHGRSGYGQPELAARLRTVFGEVCHGLDVEHRASVSPLWRGNGLSALLSVLGRHLGTSPRSLNEYAESLLSFLQTGNVVLTIRDVQRFEGGMAGFATQFWSPLSALIAPHSSRALICLASVDDVISADDVNTVTSLTRRSAPQWVPDRLIRLSRVERFSKDELVLWLARWTADAHDVAQTLMAETRGEPRQIYSKLNDPGFWVSLKVMETNARTNPATN